MSQQNIPTFSIGLDDFQVLRTVITSYLTLIYRTVPPSRKRNEEITLLQDIQRRIPSIPCHALEVQVILFVPEVQALNNALTAFAAFIRKKVPPSRDRDETLRDLERFRQHLTRTLS